MANPATTARVIGDGIKFYDGFSTLIAFAADPNVNIWEQSVTPPMVDGGDSIDITDMHNATYRTSVMRSLLTVGEASTSGGWDPNLYVQVISLINVNGSITIHFPDLSTLDFYGALRVFEPQEMSEGEQPVANFTIEVTNWDPVNRVEVGPIMTEVTGT